MAAGETRPVAWHRDPALRLLVIGSLLNSVSFFGTLPFLTLYLSDISGLSAAAIGAVVGSVPLVAAIGGLVGGSLTDRVGAARLVRYGLVGYVVIYGLLAVARSLPLIVALIVLLGVGRLLVEPAMKTMLSLAAGDGGGNVFRVRYITLCVGAMIGPVIGAGLYSISRWLIFLLPAAVFGAYLVFLTVNLPRLRTLDRPADEAPSHAAWREALTNRVLLLVVAGGFVVFFVFSQFESMLPLFIKSVRGDAAVRWFSVLLIANALLGILLQYPAERASRRLSNGVLAAVGCVAFAGALLLYGLLPTSPWFLYAGVVLWTAGEALLLPMPDMIIHAITPADRRGTYFGLAELRYLGFFAGPVVGGALLAHGPWPFFVTMAVVVFAAAPLLAGRSTVDGPGGTVGSAAGGPEADLAESAGDAGSGLPAGNAGPAAGDAGSGLPAGRAAGAGGAAG
jgi:MFS family permease